MVSSCVSSSWSVSPSARVPRDRIPPRSRPRRLSPGSGRPRSGTVVRDRLRLGSRGHPVTSSTSPLLHQRMTHIPPAPVGPSSRAPLRSATRWSRRDPASGGQRRGMAVSSSTASGSGFTSLVPPRAVDSRGAGSVRVVGGDLEILIGLLPGCLRSPRRLTAVRVVVDTGSVSARAVDAWSPGREPDAPTVTRPLRSPVDEDVEDASLRRPRGRSREGIEIVVVPVG